MVETKDDITEERRILKKAGVLDDKLLERMDIFPGDRVRFRFYYPQSGFEEIVGHFLGFYTLFEGPEGGGDLNLVIRLVKDGRTTIIYKDRNYLIEFAVTEPNFEVRDQIKDLDARHGRHVGHEFGRPRGRWQARSKNWEGVRRHSRMASLVRDPGGQRDPPQGGGLGRAVGIHRPSRWRDPRAALDSVVKTDPMGALWRPRRLVRGFGSVAVHALGEGLEPRDPLLDRRVHAENPYERPTPERVHDEEALGRRTAERDGPAPV